jgi:dTDP-4-amino-4,6-dideoxygalactose transaminase
VANPFQKINDFELALAEFTGAPYAVMTDCCTHAIELCLRVDRVKRCSIPAHTYLSVPMTLHKLDIAFDYTDIEWLGEYQLTGTRVWDSARLLKQSMYRPGMLQCLSFGYDKPLAIGRGGAILTDDVEVYNVLKRQCYDGRDLTISPWENQKIFHIGYHYRPTIEEAVRALELLPTVDQEPKPKQYPNLREIIIIK